VSRHEKGEGAVPAQLSTSLPTFAAEDPGDWSHLRDFAQAADEAGFDRLAMSDHVVFGENLEAYADPANGGSRGHKQPTGPDGSWLDPLSTIAHLTAITSRVRFATNILIAALRRPIVLAKMAATIDVLSSGRLDLGVGVGWQREEYESAGLSFENRGALLNQTIEICQVLWTESSAAYEGADLTFADIHQMPKPAQAGGIPIWVSGTVNPRAMDRLARYGSGWIPWGDDASEIKGGIERMRLAMRQRGRDPKTLGIVGSLRPVYSTDRLLDHDKTMAPVSGLLQAGVTDFRIPLNPPREAGSAARYLGDVVKAFRAAST
jgi:probable F420-dependent oxidoreductase